MHGMENVKLDTTGKQADMKACYIHDRSLEQLILPERVHVEIRTVCRTCVNHLEPGFTL
jgi:translation elongation factor EF-1alpha